MSRKRNRLVRRDGGGVQPHSVVSVSKTVAMTGPLPHPSMLREYQDIDPTMPERFLRLWESEVAHRHSQESGALSRSFDLARRGQTCAIIVVVAGQGLAAWLGFLGHPTAAGIVAGAGLAAIAGVFLASRQKA